MSDEVSWVLMVDVKEGQLDTFETLMEEMVTSTRDDPGTLIYEWFVSEDGSSVHIYERYADSAAALAHLGSFGGDLGERFFAAVETTGFHVYGDPDDATREALTGAGADFRSRFGGFAR